MAVPQHQIVCMDALSFLRSLPDQSIDLVLTSPPYWGLRDYGRQNVLVWGGAPNCNHVFELVETRFSNTSGGLSEKQETMRGSYHVEYNYRYHTSGVCRNCGAWRGQLGLEPTWRMYLDHLLQIFDEVRRVLKKTGSLYVVIGDTYCNQAMDNVSRKSLIGVPFRLATEMIERGWVLRNCLIWHKPNALPSSVKDRYNTTYEFILFFTKSRRYYFNLDAVRAPHKVAHLRMNRIRKSNTDRKNSMSGARTRASLAWGVGRDEELAHPLGKNPGDVITANTVRHKSWMSNPGHPYTHKRVIPPEDRERMGDFWNINTEPFKGAHFAVFPLSLCWRPILASCPPDGVVLDPFAGSGTVGEAVALLNIINKIPTKEEVIQLRKSLLKGNTPLVMKADRKCILVEINPEYCEIMRKRLQPFMPKL